mgnify:CR=1 FL=1
MEFPLTFTVEEGWSAWERICAEFLRDPSARVCVWCGVSSVEFGREDMASGLRPMTVGG